MNEGVMSNGDINEGVSNDAVLRCEHLAKTFNEGGLSVDVLRDVNLTVKCGERIAIVGSSGAGKSTLLHLLGGLDTATNGDVWLAEQRMMALDVSQRGELRNKYLGFIFQFHHLMPEFTALENTCMPLLIRGDLPASAKAKARIILDRVGLNKRLKHKPGELSGGERQRVAVARALVTEPRCVLADEPTGNLDHDNARQINNLLIELNVEFNTSFVVVTHEMSLAGGMDRVLVLEDGVVK